MNNRNKLRHLVADDKEYLWNYYYDDMDFTNYPYSYYLFIPKNNQKLKVRVHFSKYVPEMNLNISNEGTVCFYGEEQIVLNLCRPYYARQMIEYIFSNCCRNTDTGEIDIKNGEDILEQLGYRDFY